MCNFKLQYKSINKYVVHHITYIYVLIIYKSYNIHLCFMYNVHVIFIGQFGLWGAMYKNTLFGGKDVENSLKQKCVTLTKR